MRATSAPGTRLQPDLPAAVTVGEAIGDLPLLLGDGGRDRLGPSGRACIPYRLPAEIR